MPENNERGTKRYKAYLHIIFAAIFVVMTGFFMAIVVTRKQELHLGQRFELLIDVLPILASAPLLSFFVAYRHMTKRLPVLAGFNENVAFEIRHSLTVVLGSAYGTIMVILAVLLGALFTVGR
jgi:hypothetical protein